MQTYTYDTTFPGLLTAIFQSFARKAGDVDIVPEDQHQQQLFAEPVLIQTDEAQAKRVVVGLEKRSPGAGKWLRKIFLSEQAGTERLILHYVRRQMASRLDVQKDAADEKIRALQRLHQQMGREVHRMHAFVRFQETPDGLFVGLINPDFNCLPLLGEHFGARYPAMDWLIYDTTRQYGLHWDKEIKKAEFITLTTTSNGRLKQLSAEMLASQETGYQDLWKAYFRAVDIPERRNMPLHLQHVPRRYWQYLIEK
ncbi:TIGR03915 family putative DNA repair protein [Neolewinella antarctica]|uniref:DNA metabolism protein n=1 Tax=Neolewinella antarctica TaxID=442734 RepID=A0ABX0X9B5_9BACT|nr:TIGR03915 family putative DNA repair protein [Neolewinella antarctica]NJC25826.1 putative DNA metabolism protein [Neolewinella antarctica]